MENKKHRGMHGAFLNFTTNPTKKYTKKNSSDDPQCLLEQQGGPCRRNVEFLRPPICGPAFRFWEDVLQKAKNEATGRFFHRNLIFCGARWCCCYWMLYRGCFLNLP